MVATKPEKALQPVAITDNKPRLLLVSDSAERLQALKSCVAAKNFEIDLACSMKELRRACREPHDLVALDVAPANVIEMLDLIRGSAGNAEIPVLVECTRISNDRRLAGVLPNFRAMPCNNAEMQVLLRKHIHANGRTHSRRYML
jgi:DNA-binding response OmpR family regulator